MFNPTYALACGSMLVGLQGWGRIAKGELFDEIAELHEFVKMVGLLTMGSAYPTHEGHVYGGCLPP